MILCLLLNIACADALTPELDRVVRNLDRPDERVFILSYPRSGNTWLRYCLEFLTQRPSLSRMGLRYFLQQPLGFTTGFMLDLGKQPIEKIHCRREIVGSVTETDTLIFIVRNPKETFARQGRRGLSLHTSKLAGKGYNRDIYFDNIALYETWNNPRKLLIYYEDLLLHPRKTLEAILSFLGESCDRLDLFMSEYQTHQTTSRELYQNSRPTVDDVLYHSKKIALEERCAIDAWIVEHHPDYWSTYLKDRYAETNSCLPQ
jgi:hypothetical protein